MTPPEIYRGGIHLTTPHGPGDYPGLNVVRPGSWEYAVIVPQDGQTFTARGGERLVPYQLRSGLRAQGFTLRPGDQATRVRTGLPGFFAEWHVQRAAG